MSLALLLGPQLTAFARAGYEVVGVSAPGPFVAELVAAGISHVPLPHATRSVSLRDDGRAAASLYRLFRRLRPDIVHTHNPKPGVYGRVAARAAGVPVVVNTVHGLYATRQDSLARRITVYSAERIAAACSDAELVQNPEDLETLASLKVPRERLRLLGNGIDLERFRSDTRSEQARQRIRAEIGATDDTVVVGAVGRLVWEKGYADLFAAAAELRRLALPVLVVVVGPSEPAKSDAIGPADLAAAKATGIRLLGHRADVTDVYAAFDIYVLASYREGFPRSAMEAAAMGLPLVATDVRGCREVVDHGQTGLLVPPRDPASLAAAIARLASDPSLRRSMGECSSDKAWHEFDQKHVIDITLATYEQLLAQKRHA